MKIRSLALFVGLALLSSPFVVRADMVDVLTVQLNDGCNMEQLSKLNADFNAYGKEKGGPQYELIRPLHSATPGVVFIVGRAASMEAFGKYYDGLMAEQMQDDSTGSQLIKRAVECATVVSRSSGVVMK